MLRSKDSWSKSSTREVWAAEARQAAKDLELVANCLEATRDAAENQLSGTLGVDPAKEVATAVTKVEELSTAMRSTFASGGR